MWSQIVPQSQIEASHKSCRHTWSVLLVQLQVNECLCTSVLMACCRLLVSPVLQQWRCCGPALRHQYRYNGCRCNIIQYNLSLPTSLQWQNQSIYQSWSSQKTPHTSPLQASYGVSIVRILDKIHSITMAPHCIWNKHRENNVLIHRLVLTLHFV